MNPIRFAIERPVAVVALVVMAVLFGILALSRIPIQLAPDVRKPIVVVQTAWPGAAPAARAAGLQLERRDQQLFGSRTEGPAALGLGSGASQQVSPTVPHAARRLLPE